ncbi:hypothetical protein [Tateyamaria sp.]|uniref:hypothetical protein n=1 Tax=Tateyamaria sp. TaxID=1929288 RepID=UPI00329E5344
MSDPMTNTDVEDVLASIRRLVSDHGRPGSATVQQPPSDRLVLTPSLRVPEQDNADEVEYEDEEEAEFEDAAFAEDVEEEDDDTLSTFAETAFRSERSSPDRMNVRQTGFVPADESAVVAKLSANLTAVDASTVAKPLNEAEPSDPMVLSNRVGEFDDGTAPDPEEAMQSEDASDASIVPEDWADTLDDPATLDVADEVEEEDASEGALTDELSDEGDVAGDTYTPPENEFDETDQAVEAVKPAEKSLSEKIAALETLVGARRDQFEPDDPGTDAYAGTEPPAMEWEDVDLEVDLADQSDPELVEHAEKHSDADIEAQATHDALEEVATKQPQPQPQPDVIDAAQTEGHQQDEGNVAQADTQQDDAADATRAALFGSDDDVLDEEALRELISDIVREELQGALGERITRNVRKLVRREIHRALAAQDLE